MAEPRVKAGIWVQMALRLGDKDARPGMVLRKGDPDAGGVLVVLRGREGLTVLSQVQGRRRGGRLDAGHGHRGRGTGGGGRLRGAPASLRSGFVGCRV